MIDVKTTNGEDIAINPNQVAAVRPRGRVRSSVTVYMSGGWKFEITADSYEDYVRRLDALDT